MSSTQNGKKVNRQSRNPSHSASVSGAGYDIDSYEYLERLASFAPSLDPNNPFLTPSQLAKIQIEEIKKRRIEEEKEQQQQQQQQHTNASSSNNNPFEYTFNKDKKHEKDADNNVNVNDDDDDHEESFRVYVSLRKNPIVSYKKLHKQWTRERQEERQQQRMKKQKQIQQSQPSNK